MTVNAEPETGEQLTGVWERRRRPRIYEKFPVKVRGSDVSGNRFDTDGVLDNIGSSGLFMRVPHTLEAGAAVFIVVRLTSSDEALGSAPRVAINAEVLRVEAQADGSCGIAVRFRQHRFL